MDDITFKRLRIRSWRRGTKEMDLILGPFADTHLSELSEESAKLYEVMLEENDQDLYRWASGQEETPEIYQTLLSHIMRSIAR